MQNQLPAADTLLSQEAIHFHVLPYCKLSNLSSRSGKRQRIHFALHLP